MTGTPVETTVFHPEEVPESILNALKNDPDHYVRKDNRVYLYRNGMIICCPDNPAGLELIHTIMLHSGPFEGPPENSAELYERILRDSGFIPDDSTLSRCRVKSIIPRCVAVFQAYSVLKDDLFSSFSAIAPIEKDDVIIPIGYQSIALIKNNLPGQTEEFFEYCDAVIGSMEAEGIFEIKAGIGDLVSDIRDLRNSFLKARKALNTGIRYRRSDHVYVYSKQILERIIDSIPEESKKELHRQFFLIGPAQALSEEMLETVNVFFENDLNMTAASRQLFIHRNTLNYRLDKIKKAFGLDLRSFQDAVVFRIMSEMTDQ